MILSRGLWIFCLLFGWAGAWGMPGAGLAWAQSAPEPVVLADYAEFPEGWKVRGDRGRVSEIYRVRAEGERRVLSARVTGKSIRIFKNVSWNPFTHPVLTWKWRVLSWAEGGPGASVDFYVSLGKDSLGIPTITKYVWSRDLEVGHRRGGGFFRPHEVVIRSGLSESGRWVVARLDALESFRHLHGRDPSREAVGVGLLVSPGVVMEISEISALPAE